MTRIHVFDITAALKCRYFGQLISCINNERSVLQNRLWLGSGKDEEHAFC